MHYLLLIFITGTNSDCFLWQVHKLGSWNILLFKHTQYFCYNSLLCIRVQCYLALVIVLLVC